MSTQPIGIRSVFTNTYYRFVIVAPHTMSDDDVVSALEQRGWEVKSLGVPPPDLAKVVRHDITAPKIFWVHATWRKPSTVISDHDSEFYYGPLEILQISPVPQPPTPEDSTMSTVASIFSFTIGALLVGYGLHYFNKRRY